MATMISRCFRALAVCSLLWAATGTQAATIVGSKHDLTINAGVQLCVHCHTPHNASTQEGLADAPLWNRKITNLDAFTPYTSPTMTQTCPQRPSGISLACLSCHDGAGGGAVNATDQHSLINPPKTGGSYSGGDSVYGAGCTNCHFTTDVNTGLTNTLSVALTKMGGPDLRNDHPISMLYPVSNSNYQTPPNATTGWSDLKLFSGKVECATCHSVHDPARAPFLRAANGGSALCLRCHQK